MIGSTLVLFYHLLDPAVCWTLCLDPACASSNPWSNHELLMSLQLEKPSEVFLCLPMTHSRTRTGSSEIHWDLSSLIATSSWVESDLLEGGSKNTTHVGHQFESLWALMGLLFGLVVINDKICHFILHPQPMGPPHELDYPDFHSGRYNCESICWAWN